MDPLQPDNVQANHACVLRRTPQIVTALRSPALVPDAAELADKYMGNAAQGVTFLLALGPKQHREHRRSVNSVLQREALNLWIPAVESLAREAMKGWHGARVVEIGSEYARPVACDAALQIVGLDRSHREEVIHIAQQVMGVDTSERRRILGLSKLLRLVFAGLDGGMRIGNAYGLPTIVDMLRHQGVDEADVLGVVMPILSGVELVARAIVACICSVASMGGSQDRGLLAGGLGRGGGAVDRIIGQAGIVRRVERIAVQDVECAGVRINTGDRVHVLLRDEVDDQQRLGTVPFGQGVHYCLGASWTRLVVRCAALQCVGSWPGCSVFGREDLPENTRLGGPVRAYLRLGGQGQTTTAAPPAG